MRTHDLKHRLRKNRPMTTISLRMPGDVIEDLKRIAPRLGFGGYQPLIRAYVGQKLRVDMERLEGELRVDELVENLRRHGVDEAVLAAAIEEARDANEMIHPSR